MAHPRLRRRELSRYTSHEGESICRGYTPTRIKLKETEKKDKYPNFAGELKKLRNMKVTIITIVIEVFGTVTKGLLKGLGDSEIIGRAETIQTTTLLKTTRILRRVLET